MSDRPKPFIPAWIDDARLTPTEFRLYLHLCRRADNKTGIAWPSYESMQTVCIISRKTVWRTLAKLEKLGLIVKDGKPFGGSCRYKVLAAIVPSGERIDPSKSATMGTNEDCQSFPTGNSNRSPSDASIVPSGEREGYPLKVIQERKSIKELSLEQIQFASWFKSSLPQDQQDRLPHNWQSKYADAYDKMIRLDKRTPEEIAEVCKWARSDSFWKLQIRTPGKLRERDKQGTTYFDVITERMKQPSQSSKSPTTVNLGGRQRRNSYDEHPELPD